MMNSLQEELVLERLKAERDKQKAMFAAIPDGITTVTPDYIVRSQNSILIQRFGDLIGKLCYQGYRGFTKPCKFCPMMKAIKNNRVESAEIVAKDSRGYEIISVPFTCPDGAIHVVTQFKDATGREKADKEVRESEAKYQTLVDTMSEGLAAVDTDGILTFVNNRLSKMLEYEPREMIGKPVFDFLDLVNTKILKAELRKRSKNIASRYELTWTTKSGKQVPAFHSGVPVFDSTGKFKGSYATIVDFTERKQWEQEIKRHSEEQKAISSIATIVSRSFDLDKILNNALDKIQEMTNMDIGGIYLLDEQQRKLNLRVHRGLSQGFVREMRDIRVGEDLIASIRIQARVGKLILSTDETASKLSGLREQFSAIARDNPSSVRYFLLPAKGRPRGLMFLASNKPHEYFSHEDQLLAAISNVIGVAIENATLFYNVKAHETRLRQLLERMLKVREEEQKRIAADIHDSVAQWMISASYRTQSCSALLSEWRVDEAGDEIDHIKKLIEQSVAELRRLIVDLYPPTLAEVGLEQALCQNIGSFQSETGIVCHFQVEGTLKRISPSLEMAVYRIVQESMNNVRKHSHATELSIRLRFEPNEVWAEIRDNGHGFSVDKILGDETMLGHMGLITMKDRAETLGGSLAITASPGAGTSIILTLPVSPHQSSLGAEEP